MPEDPRINEAVGQPKNLGAMENADAVGTVGSADCGDMLRMWIKFKEENGRRVIDKATFQTFGCETAIAVASLVQMKPMLLFQGVMAAATPTGSMTTAALPICRVKV